MRSFRRAVWLFPVAFAAHIAEEASGFTAWARRHGSSRYSQADFIRNNAVGLAMTVAGTALVSRAPTRPVVFSYFAIVLTQQALFNALFHTGTTVAYREYSPGLFSALAGCLPLWWHLSRLARSKRLISDAGAMWAAAIGGAIHTVAVVQQVYRR